MAFLLLLLLLKQAMAQSVMPQASCVPKTGGDPRLVVFISLANQSEPIVQGGSATQQLFIAHDEDSQGAAANLEVKWSLPKQLEFDSAQNINGPEYTSLISQESTLIIKFDKLESCQNITLAINLKVDGKKGTSPGKTSPTSTFVAVEYYWEDESLDGAVQTERTRFSFEFYAPNIDECVSSVHDCHRFASCTDTAGSYTCTCNQPLTGDGKTCRYTAPAGLNYSSIVGNSQIFLTWLDKWLKPVTRQSSYWNRCYQATVNGWSSSTFHSNCDGRGPTVTIIRVAGKYIFGGYTSLSWSSSCRFHYDSSAFLFSLVNKPGWQPLKLNQTGWESYKRSSSIFSCSSYGPTFGNGRDIQISNNAGSDSYSRLGWTYSLPGNSRESSFTLSFLAGSFTFRPDEVEVFYETT